MSFQQQKLSREDRKKARELEDLRKAGAAPPEVDEDGNMINPHIPQYIKDAPWYLNATRAGLKHQTNKNFSGKAAVAGLNDHAVLERVDHGRKRWVKGACTNCGAKTHKRKDCMERPRRKGARLTHTQIAQDEVLHTTAKQSFGGKRDAYKNYDPKNFNRELQKFEAVDQARKELKEKQLESTMKVKQAAKEARRQKKGGEVNKQAGPP